MSASSFGTQSMSSGSIDQPVSSVSASSFVTDGISTGASDIVPNISSVALSSFDDPEFDFFLTLECQNFSSLGVLRTAFCTSSICHPRDTSLVS